MPRLAHYAATRALELALVLRAARTLVSPHVDRNWVLQADDVGRLDDHLGVGPVPEAEPEAPLYVLPVARMEEDSAPLARVHTDEHAARVLLHDDFLSAWFNDAPEGVQRRVNLVLRQLMAHGRTSIVKGTQGHDNHGWRRSPAGGNGGRHFYVWWTLRGAPPTSHLDAELAPNTLLIRALRHHDDHRPCAAGALGDYHREITDALADSRTPQPWNLRQRSFVDARTPVRCLDGPPGTGKTTALWQSVVERADREVLYLTWSTRLVEDARDYFRVYAAMGTTVRCLTFAGALAALDPRPRADPDVKRSELLARLAMMGTTHPHVLGPWRNRIAALAVELRAHFVGARLAARANEDETDRREREIERYTQARTPAIGPEAVDKALLVVRHLERQASVEGYFPDLQHAWEVARRLESEPAAGYVPWTPDRIVIDEIQDLTLLEVRAITNLARAAGARRDPPRTPAVVCAGDEGQTIRGTDFAWARLKDLLHEELGRDPEHVRLETNVRCPPRIAQAVERVGELYRHLPWELRPQLPAPATGEEEPPIEGQIYHLVLEHGPDLALLIDEFAPLENAAVIVAGDQRLAGLDATASPDVVLATALVKGREYQTVCVLAPGSLLEEIGRATEDEDDPEAPLARLHRRAAIDALRVALSRSTEVLILVDVTPETGEVTTAFLKGLPHTCAEDATDLTELLRQEEVTEDRIHNAIQSAHELKDTNPALAWRRAAQAVSMLAELPRSDKMLARDAHRARVRIGTLWSFKLATARDHERATKVLAESKASTDAAEEPAALRPFLDALARWYLREDASERVALLRALDAVADGGALPNWLATITAAHLPRWIAAVEADALALREWARIVRDLDRWKALAGLVGRTGSELALELVPRLLDARRARDGLALLDQIAADAPLLRGRCLRQEGRHAAAARELLRADELELALGACLEADRPGPYAEEAIAPLGTVDVRAALAVLLAQVLGLHAHRAPLALAPAVAAALGRTPLRLDPVLALRLLQPLWTEQASARTSASPSPDAADFELVCAALVPTGLHPEIPWLYGLEGHLAHPPHNQGRDFLEAVSDLARVAELRLAGAHETQRVSRRTPQSSPARRLADRLESFDLADGMLSVLGSDRPQDWQRALRPKRLAGATRLLGVALAARMLALDARHAERPELAWWLELARHLAAIVPFAEQLPRRAIDAAMDAVRRAWQFDA